MMAAREIRECAGLINKVTYKPANDLSHRLREHGTIPRASLGRKMSFRVRAADQKRVEIKFPNGYGEVTVILFLSANLQIEIVRDLISANGSGTCS